MAILIGAFGANATDAEVKAAVQKVKAEVLTKQEQTIDQVLKTLAALEVKVTNGDTLMMMEFVLTDINRLKRERKTAEPPELLEIDDALRKRKVQFDDLMDSLRIDPAPPN